MYMLPLNIVTDAQLRTANKPFSMVPRVQNHTHINIVSKYGSSQVLALVVHKLHQFPCKTTSILFIMNAHTCLNLLTQINTNM